MHCPIPLSGAYSHPPSTVPKALCVPLASLFQATDASPGRWRDGSEAERQRSTSRRGMSPTSRRLLESAQTGDLIHRGMERLRLEVGNTVSSTSSGTSPLHLSSHRVERLTGTRSPDLDPGDEDPFSSGLVVDQDESYHPVGCGSRDALRLVRLFCFFAVPSFVLGKQVYAFRA